MTDLYLLAAVRMKELRREVEMAYRGNAPQADFRTVRRSRIVLAQWLVAAARRLSPEVAGNVVEGAR
ncbi:hypothetical protein [Actinoplanes sp. NPDC049265]|uniref:hypothetical protein n=1 Tax=Actinoplanes sp. NPDC049265 TaxID=3363902 RepID=UPI003712FAF5